MLNVFLDDLRPVPKGFVLARTVEEAIRLVNHYYVKTLSLDHDLGGFDGTYQKTGYDFCKLLVEMWVEHREHGIEQYMAMPEDIYLHTSNPVGRENMLQLLNHYKPDYVTVHRSPMPSFNLATGETIE